MPGARPAPPNAVSAGERRELLALLDSPRFADKAPRQVWAVLIDEGAYLASVSTMYRLLREAGQVRERRAQAAHPARTKPELIAGAPNEVWSWDITKLAGPLRGVYYHLYVMIDIFSRCAVHFEVHATELGELAKDFMTEAVRLTAASRRWPYRGPGHLDDVQAGVGAAVGPGDPQIAFPAEGQQR